MTPLVLEKVERLDEDGQRADGRRVRFLTRAQIEQTGKTGAVSFGRDEIRDAEEKSERTEVNRRYFFSSLVDVPTMVCLSQSMTFCSEATPRASQRSPPAKQKTQRRTKRRNAQDPPPPRNPSRTPLPCPSTTSRPTPSRPEVPSPEAHSGSWPSRCRAPSQTVYDGPRWLRLAPCLVESPKRSTGGEALSV